jgi:hypothetical protein
VGVDPELSRKRADAARSGWKNLTAEERRARTAKARAARYRNLADEVDPNHELPDEERLRLARELQRVRLAEATLRSRSVALQRAQLKRTGSPGNVSDRSSIDGSRNSSGDVEAGSDG